MNRKSVRSVSPGVLDRAAEIIRMLGHPVRLKIVEVLEERESTVTEIQEVLGVRQAIVSQHLARMRGCGIVTSRREGVNVIYSLVEPKVPRILQCIRDCDL